MDYAPYRLALLDAVGLFISQRRARNRSGLRSTINVFGGRGEWAFQRLLKKEVRRVYLFLMCQVMYLFNGMMYDILNYFSGIARAVHCTHILF